MEEIELEVWLQSRQMRLENAYEYPAMRLIYSPACFCSR
jgi:hypothetical protein